MKSLEKLSAYPLTGMQFGHSQVFERDASSRSLLRLDKGDFASMAWTIDWSSTKLSWTDYSSIGEGWSRAGAYQEIFCTLDETKALVDSQRFVIPELYDIFKAKEIFMMAKQYQRIKTPFTDEIIQAMESEDDMWDTYRNIGRAVYASCVRIQSRSLLPTVVTIVLNSPEAFGFTLGFTYGPEYMRRMLMPESNRLAFTRTSVNTNPHITYDSLLKWVRNPTNRDDEFNGEMVELKFKLDSECTEKPKKKRILFPDVLIEAARDGFLAEVIFKNITFIMPCPVALTSPDSVSGTLPENLVNYMVKAVGPQIPVAWEWVNSRTMNSKLSLVMPNLMSTSKFPLRIMFMPSRRSDESLVSRRLIDKREAASRYSEIFSDDGEGLVVDNDGNPLNYADVDYSSIYSHPFASPVMTWPDEVMIVDLPSLEFRNK
jgi:hypothetical protein